MSSLATKRLVVLAVIAIVLVSVGVVYFLVPRQPVVRVVGGSIQVDTTRSGHIHVDELWADGKVFEVEIINDQFLMSEGT